MQRTKSFIFCCVLQGHGAIAAMLMREGSDLGLRDADGRTALHLAAHNGHAGVCVQLVHHAARCVLA